MNFKRHVYKSNREKVGHFIGGLFGWWILGTPFFIFVLDMEWAGWLGVLLYYWLTVRSAFGHYWVGFGLILNMMVNIFLLFRLSEHLAFVDLLFYLGVPSPFLLLLFTID